MDGYEQQLRSLISTGAADAKQIERAVDLAFSSSPRVYDLAVESLPADLREFSGAVVVAAADVLSKELKRHLVNRVRQAADPIKEAKCTPIATAIDEFALGDLTFELLVKVVITQRAVSKVLNEENRQYRKPNIQLVDADGNRESFDDAYDRIQFERNSQRWTDALSLLLRTESARILRNSIISLKPSHRVVLALRHDLFGASAALQLAARPEALPRSRPETVTFKKWLVEVLDIDKIEAARIISRYRRHALKIRERAFANQVRTSSFVISNEDIGRLLDRQGSAITQMETTALNILRKLYAQEIDAA
jgi:hypothetical protein